MKETRSTSARTRHSFALLTGWAFFLSTPPLLSQAAATISVEPDDLRRNDSMRNTHSTNCSAPMSDAHNPSPSTKRLYRFLPAVHGPWTRMPTKKIALVRRNNSDEV